MRVPLSEFEGGPGVPLLNFVEVAGPPGPGPTFTPSQFFDAELLLKKNNTQTFADDFRVRS